MCDSNIPTRDAIVILGEIDNNVPTTSINIDNETMGGKQIQATTITNKESQKSVSLQPAKEVHVIS